MDKKAVEFVDNLLTREALEQPSDKGKPEELVLELPPWFDEYKFNQARRFYWDNSFAFSSSILLGLVAVLAVPSILKVLISSRRSNSLYTAYKRYLSTQLHVVSWFEHDLKPGSRSWKSLHAVRSRHIKAGKASKLKGGDVVSQRDIALTQFSLIGFAVLKPHLLGIGQSKEGDWEAYNHFWRVIGYMLGLEDRYNICRSTMDETRDVCQLLQQQVYTPCLENVPEYFEHTARVMLDGIWHVNPTLEYDAILYHVKYLADVPGYIYTEADRIKLERTLKEKLKGKPLDEGVDSRELMQPTRVEGLPERPPRLLYLRDYASVDTAPEYKRMSLYSRYKLALLNFMSHLHTTYWGRLFFNLNVLWGLFLMKYCPYLAFFKFGIKASLVDIFTEGPVDDTVPKPNAEYYKTAPPLPWYKSWASWLSIFW